MRMKSMTYIYLIYDIYDLHLSMSNYLLYNVLKQGPFYNEVSYRSNV